MPRGFAGEAEVRLDCQFVMNTPVTKKSTVKTPHIDLCDKIFSALFYMRDPRDDSTGGDLDIYDWRREPRFIKHRTLNRDVELVKTVTYQANSYLCFVNSAQAVHGVSPRDLTQVPRRYINFIAELPIKAFEPKQLNRLQKFWYADEVDEIPLRRLGLVSDVAEAAVYLASPASAYVTGQQLVVDGGVSVRGPFS